MRRVEVLRAFLVVAGLAILLGMAATVAQAAPLGGLKQFRVPTAGERPQVHHAGLRREHVVHRIGQRESARRRERAASHNIRRITPDGEITELPARFREPPIPPDESELGFCFPNDTTQGPNDILYFAKSEDNLGRMSSATGKLFSNINIPFGPGAIAVDGDDLWPTDFGGASI